MAFADIVNTVYTYTNRPDREAETAAAVTAAILWAHHSDYFYKDLVEVPAQFNSLQYLQQIPLSFFPQFRALKYVRKYYPGTGPNNPPAQDQSPNNLPPLYGMFYDPGANLPDGRFFNILTPDNVLDPYHINKIDVAYIAGQTLQIRSGDYFQYALCGYYAHPLATAANCNSWIVNEFPDCLGFRAAEIVFKAIGYDEQAQFYQSLAAETLAQVVMSNIVAEGE
jgi:hypothetical protein